MRAVQVHEFGPPSSLILADVPEPAAGPGEVVVEVEAAGVNFPDVLVVEGTYQNLPEKPFSPGTEAAGTVVAVGEGVRRVTVGQRVLALVEHGAFTERLLVHENLVVELPSETSFEEAASFGLAHHTAHFGLVRRARVRPGEWVLITGASGAVGSAALQLAKVLGANVIALVRDPAHAERARARGADAVLIADVDTLRDDLLWATGGHGVDVTLDVVGGDVFSQVIRATAWEGRVVIVGFASGGQNPIKPGHLLVKNIAGWVCRAATTCSARRNCSARRCRRCSSSTPRASSPPPWTRPSRSARPGMRCRRSRTASCGVRPSWCRNANTTCEHGDRGCGSSSAELPQPEPPC